MSNTTTTITEPKTCDICDDDTRAEYDARTAFGPWAYMFEDHFRKAGVGLGTGKGQRLELDE